eukprot:GFKZ01005336.1.p1 GENE.GFKZ01005336.1~~GFKZ01005336.1.p1  ORF type:complete len:322 (+),score=34.69 GFKZ01005336.1:197-1162(+)
MGVECRMRRTPSVLFVPLRCPPVSSMSPSKATSDRAPPLPSGPFWNTYHGHPPAHLQMILSHTPSPRIFLAGDSTLDNKYWLPNSPHPLPGSYRSLLSPPVARRDIAYWLNTLQCAAHSFTAVNCAVEATTLGERRFELLAQDEVIVEHMTKDDVLIVSVGGNDIALRPQVGLALAVLTGTYFGGDWGIASLRRHFVDGVREYVSRLTARVKPRLIVVCSLYFLDEKEEASWANWVLKLLRYGSRPEKVQRVMRRVGESMIDGLGGMDGVVVVPLYEALDGKRSEDYVQRVEPSEEGGRKMAQFLLSVVGRELGQKRMETG